MRARGFSRRSDGGAVERSAVSQSVPLADGSSVCTRGGRSHLEGGECGDKKSVEILNLESRANLSDSFREAPLNSWNFS